MNQSSELRTIVAEFLEVDPGSIGRHTQLGGTRLSSSLARAGLDAALRRRLGIKCQAIYIAQNYGDLESAVLGEDGAGESGITSRAVEVLPTPSIEEPAGQPVGCGVDVVEVSELPNANDFWEHEFYQELFADAEIAYCSTQTHPHEHFAARWAAKEALKKASRKYLSIEPRDLEVVHSDSGAPSLKLRGTVLPVSLSLSHTSTLAIAMVVTGGAEPTPTPDSIKVTTTESSRHHARSAAPTRRLKRFSVPILALAALGIALWGLWRTFTY